MSVAKFTAASGREAMRQVRQALGPDAVVLANRAVEGGVEIVAMIGDEAAAVAAAAPAYVHPLPVADDGALGQLRGELQSMRALLERQMAGMGAPAAPAGDPLRESLFDWLVGAGFSARLARSLLARLPAGHDRPAATAWARQEIAAKVPVLADEDALFDRGGVLALVGPTGVGKTTTTAKLAARFVLRHGAAKLALLTTDSFRIGAHEQLRIYGDILGVAVHAVKDAADLRFALAAMHDRHLVIIDTVGMSQRDRNLSEQTAMLAGAADQQRAPMQRLLLLNGASHGDTLNEVVHAYRGDTQGGGIDGCILTKLDEATHLGAALDVVIRHRLPVFYASTGQRVPEHLERADAAALVERAFLTPRRGSVFADADAVRRQANVGEPAEADNVDMLRTIAGSGSAVHRCVAELDGGPYGFACARALWQQRADPRLTPRQLAARLREALCADSRHVSERHVLALQALPRPRTAGRRAAPTPPQTLWLGDRDGLPLLATVPPAWADKAGGLATEIAALRGTLGVARTLVNLTDGLPPSDMLARWQAAGERWMAKVRRQTAVTVAGKSWKLDALADSLTFHAAGDCQWRGADATQWVAETAVRVSEGQGRGASGLEVRLVASRIVGQSGGAPLAVRYLLCDPLLDADAARIAQWAGWQADADASLRTLGHALDHFADSGATAAAMVAALQLGLTAMRLERVPTAIAPAFLARLAGRDARSAASPAPSGPILNEGLGRLLALLDVLERYPGRPADAERSEASGEEVA